MKNDEVTWRLQAYALLWGGPGQTEALALPHLPVEADDRALEWLLERLGGEESTAPVDCAPPIQRRGMQYE